MCHALIVNDNRVISRGIQDQLQACGFDSFDHTWSERQALEAAARHSPDLVVIGGAIAGGSPLEVARKVASEAYAPVLAVTTEEFTFERRFPTRVATHGPFRLSQLSDALAAVGMPAARSLASA